MTFLSFIFDVFCIEIVVLLALCVYFLAVGMFGKTKDFTRYDNENSKHS